MLNRLSSALTSPGWFTKRRATGDVGEDDGLTAGRGAGDPAQANLELGQVHEWDERLQRLEPRHRGGPDRKVRLDRLDIPQAQGQGLRESDRPARARGVPAEGGMAGRLARARAAPAGREGGCRSGAARSRGAARASLQRGALGPRPPAAGGPARPPRSVPWSPRRPPFRIHHTRSLRRTTVVSSMWTVADIPGRIRFW